MKLNLNTSNKLECNKLKSKIKETETKYIVMQRNRMK